jgi:hypothetical protein
MNRDKLLMFSALLMACAGFLMLSQSVHAGHDAWSIHAVELAR